MLVAIVSVVLVTSALVQGQAVRGIPKSSPSPTPAISQTGDPATYKFIYVEESIWKAGGYLSEEKVELALAKKAILDHFLTNINDAGNAGYKVISPLWGDFAIAKLEEGPYEYKVFEATSSRFFFKERIGNELVDLTEEGFKIYDHSLLGSECSADVYAGQNIGESCEYSDFYLFGKKKGSKKQTEQVIAASFPGWSYRPSVGLELDIDTKLAEGFYPVKALSKFEILLERVNDKNDLLADKPDVQVVRSGGLTNDLKNKVNELAKQGYRLFLANDGIAVMYRNKQATGKAVSYVWLRSDKKSFEKDLAELQHAGARYVYACQDDHGKKISSSLSLTRTERA